jgi:transcriptional regulator with GAF, ATPase, and Fis domain
MSNRAGHLSAAEQADLGRVARAMHEAGGLWKQIAEELGLGERQMRRCARRARLMTANSLVMTAHADCNPACDAATTAAAIVR